MEIARCYIDVECCSTRNENATGALLPIVQRKRNQRSPRSLVSPDRGEHGKLLPGGGHSDIFSDPGQQNYLLLWGYQALSVGKGKNRRIGCVETA